jgi:hypothetical protein
MPRLRDGAQLHGRTPGGLEVFERFDGTFGACGGRRRRCQGSGLGRGGRRTRLPGRVAARHGEGREAEAESERDEVLHDADVTSEVELKLRLA